MMTPGLLVLHAEIFQGHAGSACVFTKEKKNERWESVVSNAPDERVPFLVRWRRIQRGSKGRIYRGNGHAEGSRIIKTRLRNSQNGSDVILGYCILLRNPNSGAFISAPFELTRIQTIVYGLKSPQSLKSVYTSQFSFNG